VNVTSPDHISYALKFAIKHNIRVVIRNTGHDYNGKSTGAGALAIWTHHLKDLEIHEYKDKHYAGKAITMGAGIQGFEAYEIADENNLQVVGGECPTVGLAGGYSQGGGHSALSSRYGLGADQVLKWEVVDGQGNYITATRDNEYSDLFWALSGGGGGTYGVVWSMTSKAHPGTPVSGLNLTYTNTNLTADTFYSTVEKFHENLPALVDAGAMCIWYYTNTSFMISPITGPNIPMAKLVNLLKPFTTSLDKLNINYTMTSGQYSSYYSQFKDMQGTIEVGTAQYGGYLIPRSVVENNNKALVQTYREITEAGATFIGVGLNASHKVSGNVYNAVLPAWREALIDTTLTTPWEWNDDALMVKRQKQMTYEFIPKLEALAPNSGAYMNEVRLLTFGSPPCYLFLTYMISSRLRVTSNNSTIRRSFMVATMTHCARSSPSTIQMIYFTPRQQLDLPSGERERMADCAKLANGIPHGLSLALFDNSCHEGIFRPWHFQYARNPCRNLRMVTHSPFQLGSTSPREVIQ
jgi:hypothetical protein